MVIESDPASRIERSAQPSTTTLLSRLLDDAASLVRNELALAKAELIESAHTLTGGIAAMAIGAVIGVTGLLAIVAAAVLALAEIISPWLAALIIGAALAIAGFVTIQASNAKLKGSDPGLEQTSRSLREDAAVAARRK